MAHHYAEERKRNQQWLERLAAAERDGIGTDAAVSAIEQEWNVSRATVYAGVKKAERILELCKSFEPIQRKPTGEFDNPRPSKNALD